MLWNTSPSIRLYSGHVSVHKGDHHVYMRFERRQYWHVSFTEAGLERELPCKLTFTSSGKILELARKGEAWGHARDPASSRTCY
jgi:hypothetical protein